MLCLAQVNVSAISILNLWQLMELISVCVCVCVPRSTDTTSQWCQQAVVLLGCLVNSKPISVVEDPFSSGPLMLKLSPLVMLKYWVRFNSLHALIWCSLRCVCKAATQWFSRTVQPEPCFILGCIVSRLDTKIAYSILGVITVPSKALVRFSHQGLPEGFKGFFFPQQWSDSVLC